MFRLSAGGYLTDSPFFRTNSFLYAERCSHGVCKVPELVWSFLAGNSFRLYPIKFYADSKKAASLVFFSAGPA